MSKSPEFIRAQLANLLQADCSEQRVENNQYIYSFRFSEGIGFDWAEAQVHKARKSLDIELELWKIRPSGVNDFEIEVREVQKREGIDDNQQDFSDFES